MPEARLGPYADWLHHYGLGQLDDRYGAGWCWKSQLLVTPGLEPKVSILLHLGSDHDAADIGATVARTFQSQWDEDMA